MGQPNFQYPHPPSNTPGKGGRGGGHRHYTFFQNETFNNISLSQIIFSKYTGGGGGVWSKECIQTTLEGRGGEGLVQRMYGFFAHKNDDEMYGPYEACLHMTDSRNTTVGQILK